LNFCKKMSSREVIAPFYFVPCTNGMAKRARKEKVVTAYFPGDEEHKLYQVQTQAEIIELLGSGSERWGHIAQRLGIGRQLKAYTHIAFGPSVDPRGRTSTSGGLKRFLEQIHTATPPQVQVDGPLRNGPPPTNFWI